jgi:hypothetical protein
MTVSLKHTFQSAKTDSTDTTIVQPSNWNEEHVLTAAAGKVLGRDTSGSGVVQELPISVTPAGNVTIPNNFTVTGTTTLTTALAAASGGTGITSVGASGNVLTSNGTTWASTALPTSPVTYPQNSQSANYTLVAGDAGKQIFHPASDTATRTYTIPSNASVAFPIGTTVLFTVENAGFPVSVAITSDTLILGSGITGTATVSPNNTLMAIKVTATKWMANYLFDEQNTPYAVAVAHSSDPFISAYPWSKAGFGTKYSNPGFTPVGISGYLAVAFSPAGNAVAYSYDTVSPLFGVYRWSASGFGNTYADPATLPTSDVNTIAFSPAADAIAVASLNTPYVLAYPWNSSTGFGAKYTNPGTLPANQAYGVAFSPAGTTIAVSHFGTPFVSVYPWSVGSGFGTKYANPGTTPTGIGYSVAFSPASDAIAVAHDTTPFISAYPWSVGSGFGTKYTNPATLPSSSGRGVAFNPLGDAIAVTTTGSPFVTVYPWSGSGFGTKYTDPTVLPSGLSNSVAFSPSGDALAVAHQITPFVSAYRWSKAGFGNKYSNPTTTPTGAGRKVAFNTNV